MFKNFCTTAWRNLRNYKSYAILNISGLAIGIACFILIAHYVIDELSYDLWNPYAHRIFRVDGEIKFGGDEMHLAVSSDPMGATLKKDYPQVEEYVRFYASDGGALVKKGDQFIQEDNVCHADSTLLKVFPYFVLAGDALHPLDGPDKVILSESSAIKYFGKTDLHQIIGKTIETDRSNRFFTVTAIIRDMPSNSHFNKDFIFSMQNVKYQFGNFLSNNFNTYLLLRQDANANEFNKNFPDFINKYILPQVQQFAQIKNMDEFEKAGNKLKYFLTPLKDIHLHSNKVAEMGANGNIQYIFIFSAVALFILLIACVNFMNLSTAHATNRAKEVGVRKVLGTEKSKLVFQFLTESTLLATVSTILGIIIVVLMIPYFNDLAAKSYLRKEFFKPFWLSIYILLPLVLGVLAGLYPAFYMSDIKPIAVLKGKLQGSFNKNRLRSGLVVFQFATSIMLIIGAIVVYSQLKYIQTRNIGFQKDQVLIIEGTNSLGSQTKAFKNEIAGLNGIVASSYTGYLPVSRSSRNDNTYFKDAAPDLNRGLNMQKWTIDQEYIPLLGMEIVKGRNFSTEFGTDSSGVILNEEAIKLLGFEEDPLNQKIYGGSAIAGGLTQYHIIGVVKNFNYASLRENVGPLGFFFGNADWVTSFKINTSESRALLSHIEAKWKSMANGAPFSYRFLDQSFDEMYRTEQRVGKISLTFSILAIFIACLGLFGLATFIAERRTKEIGIRKVLGADIPGIVVMLSKEFIKLVILAAIIAFPLGYYLMHKWLQDFSFRIDIQWWMFLLAGGSAIVIALLTVSFQAIRSAMMNPIKSLRTE